MSERLQFSTKLAAPREFVFDWHERPGAFERLSPPWDKVRLVESQGGIRDGGRATLEVPIGPFRIRWLAEHRGYDYGRSFDDIQLRVPFREWLHRRRFEDDASGCRLDETLEYRLPLGLLGRMLAESAVRERLHRVFQHRSRVLQWDVEAHYGAREHAPKRILISGAGGLVGSHLRPFLSAGGHQITALVRRAPQTEAEIRWDPAKRELDASLLEGFDAVIHLAGESIEGRWSAEKKTAILSSRVESTRLLAETLAKLSKPPSTLISASAIGFYGSRGDTELTEEATQGEGFLPEVAAAWEEAASAAREAGIRVIHPRFGMILSPKGGALARLLPLARLGMAGPIGSGRQFVSWVAMDDVLYALLHLLTNSSLSGPVNVVSPEPVRQRDFASALGAAVSRPTLVPTPALVVRMAMGREAADSLVLASQRVVPAKLLDSGFVFKLPRLSDALEHLLGR
ncbi:MAG: hypothetical protein AMXMBFR61_00050 [Fimbriimonadales bacterium]